MNLFEEDNFSDFYRFRNQTGQPKKVKFLIFSSFKPALDVDKHYNKRKREDDSDNYRDVDFIYLKENFIDRYAMKVNREDHLDIYQNVKDTELFEVFGKLEDDTELFDYDCFMFVFLTYVSPNSTGNSETKIHFYNSQVALDKIWDRVSKIEAMKGKPKVFLVQADDVRLMEEPPRITKAGGFAVVERKIPTDSDRLTIMSMIPGKHFVHGNEPSFLIQAFVEALNENEYAYEQLDLLSLTSLINKKVSNLIESSTVQKTKNQKDQLPIPCTTSTLRKLLLL